MNALKHFNLFNNIKIQKQLFSTLLIIISVPILTTGIILVVNAKHNITKSYTEQVSTENARVKAVLFDLTTNLYNISENFILNPQLDTLLSEEYENNSDIRKAFDQYKAITQTLSQQTSIYKMIIYHNNPTIGDYPNFSYCSTKIRTTDWYQKIKDQSVLWNSSEYIEHGSVYHHLTLYRKIPLPLKNDFAVLSITVSRNYLKNRLDNNYIPSIISVNSEPVFYSNIPLECSDKMPVKIKYSEGHCQNTSKVMIDDTAGIGTLSTLQPYRSDNYIYILSYSKAAVATPRRLAFTYSMILLLAFFIPSVLLYCYTCYFSARVSLLRSAMHQASLDDYNIINSFKGHDELSETFDDLLVMIKKIQYKEAYIYKALIREQELINKQQQMELKILTSQINPHFLYNTLESIRMKAFNNNDNDVATGIKLLGRYLHYALESLGKTDTTLSEELYYVELYLNIQKIRFNNRVNYKITLEPCLNAEQYHILPFLLQPIIENSVLHGLEGIAGNGMINILIFTEKNQLNIQIKDNGEGMQPEELQSLRKNIVKKDFSKTKSIGLYNINQRIILYYGPQYGITIDSKKGKGTVIELRLPLDRLISKGGNHIC